jgi:uncharacterized protein (UPF0333 family)
MIDDDSNRPQMSLEWLLFLLCIGLAMWAAVYYVSEALWRAVW